MKGEAQNTKRTPLGSYYTKYEGAFKMLDGIWGFQQNSVKTISIINAGASIAV